MAHDWTWADLEREARLEARAFLGDPRGRDWDQWAQETADGMVPMMNLARLEVAMSSPHIFNRDVELDGDEICVARLAGLAIYEAIRDVMEEEREATEAEIEAARSDE